MIIDATDMIAGRLAAVVAKKALLGEKIDIVNAEKAVMTGKKTSVFADYAQMKGRTVALKGPFIHRGPDRLLRRIIRGMLPYKKPRGRDAFASIMCWKGIPAEFKDKKMETLKEANISKVQNLHRVSIGDISKNIGGKLE